MNILFISYFFPPMGGAGVQRSTKLVKYLPSVGVTPVVLTSLVQAPDRWTPRDDTLADSIPQGTDVRRIRWPKPNTPEYDADFANFIEFATAAAAETKPKAIFVTVSPFYDLKLAEVLSKRLGLPWVADLRDPWALDEFQVFKHFRARASQQRAMERALAPAAAVIMNTPQAARELQDHFASARTKIVAAITNGFDADEVQRNTMQAPNSHFTIVHSGFFHTGLAQNQTKKHAINWLLGRTTKGLDMMGRTPFYLFQALSLIRHSHPEMTDRMRVIFLGVDREEDHALAGKFGVQDLVQFRGYVPHSESVSIITAADLLFLPMHGLGKGHRASIVPGKTYEYMATDRCILAAVPEGDARDFLRQRGNVSIVDPLSSREMQNEIQRRFRSWEAGDKAEPINWDFVHQFSRHQIAAKVAGVLRSVVKNP